MEKLDIKKMASNPLKFTVYLSPQVSVETVVSGDARNIAGVTIKSGTMPVWSGNMYQTSPNLVADPDLILGDMEVKNATFKLTIPTALQQGNVFMSAIIKSAGNPDKTYQALIAIWDLSASIQ